MEKLSAKFANLGPSGLVRQLAPKGGDAHAHSKPVIAKPPAVSAKPAAGGTWEEPKLWVGPVAKPKKIADEPRVPKKSDAERVKAWRDKNRERYNESMRKQRAKKKRGELG